MSTVELTNALETLEKRYREQWMRVCDSTLAELKASAKFEVVRDLRALLVESESP